MDAAEKARLEGVALRTWRIELALQQQIGPQPAAVGVVQPGLRGLHAVVEARLAIGVPAEFGGRLPVMAGQVGEVSLQLIHARPSRLPGRWPGGRARSTRSAARWWRSPAPVPASPATASPAGLRDIRRLPARGIRSRQSCATDYVARGSE